MDPLRRSPVRLPADDDRPMGDRSGSGDRYRSGWMLLQRARAIVAGRRLLRRRRRHRRRDGGHRPGNEAAPAEIRGDWDVVFAIEAGDPTERALAQGRVDAFDAAHC
jgi:hypothetical protein